MPKGAEKNSQKLKRYVKDFGSDIFKTDSKILYCKACEQEVGAERKSLITQHISTNKHKSAVIKLKNNPKKEQQLLPLVSETIANDQKYFQKRLCEAMISADISYVKLNNETLRKFFKDFIPNFNIPDQSHIRKNILPLCYNETIKKIRDKIGINKIWICVDETTDIKGQKVANLIVGILRSDKYEPSFLLNSKVLQSANHRTISTFVEQSLLLLWPMGVEYDRVLLLVTDGAPYMIKAGKGLKDTFYGKMIHITCLAHGIHLLAEEIRSSFKNIDKIIANIKAVFLKAPNRVEVFREIAPDLALPPKPVITRWGTWISAALYYVENIETIENIIQTLDSNDAASIKLAKYYLSKPNVRQDLVYIKANFESIPNAITKLEKKGLQLIDSIKIITDLCNSFNNLRGNTGLAIKNKWEQVLVKNPGYKSMLVIAKILNGDNADISDIEVDLTVEEISLFKYAPITSCDVERSFSQYKTLLRSNRLSFTEENFKMTLITHCNA
jgi:hypothetical protein